MTKIFTAKAMIFGLLFFLYQQSSAYQFQIFKANKYDIHGKRHGKWKFYNDNEDKLLFSKGRFKHGSTSGIWKYYDANGKLRRKEKYSKSGDTIKTTFYYPNGNVECTGLAKLDSEVEQIHYYWDGPWKYFDKKGKPQKTVIYKMGNEIAVEKF